MECSRQFLPRLPHSGTWRCRWRTGFFFLELACLTRGPLVFRVALKLCIYNSPSVIWTIWGEELSGLPENPDSRGEAQCRMFCFVCFLWRCSPTRAVASSFLRFLDHTQRRITVGRTPLDEWSALVAETSTWQHTTLTTDRQQLQNFTGIYIQTNVKFYR